MDTLHKSNDKPLAKKNKLPPTTKSYASNTDSFHNSENRLKSILNPAVTNKLNSSFNIQRSAKKESNSSISRHYESSPPGKENKSQSPKRKRSTSTSKSRPINNNSSVLKGKALKQAFNTTIRKPSPSKTPNVHDSFEKKTKVHHGKTRSGQNLEISGILHRRHNSSLVGQQSRVYPQERKSSHISRNMNNSMLNNSSLIEDPMNYSREYSYLKDCDTSEFVHFGELAGLYNSSNNSTLKIAGLNDQSSLGLNEENLSSPQIREDFIPHTSSKSLFKRGRSFFKQRKYQEAADCIKESLEYKEENIEALYLLGVSYLWLAQYQSAQTELVRLIEKEGSAAKCSVLILLSTVYKKMGDIPSAIKTLTRAITKHPDRSDTYIFRAKLYLKLKDWERALSDFQHAVKIDPSRGIAYIGQGDAFRMLVEYKEAVDCYTKAIEANPPLARIALLKRALAYTELKRYDEATQDLDEVILEEPKHSEAQYFKGLILEKKGDANEAILCFEQAIKHNTSKKFVSKALYEIARIKIEGRNFYEACHAINRAELLGLDQSYFKKLKLFTEGVIYLMKKKFDEGVANLTLVLKHHLSPALIPMVYNYRAFGYFSCGKIKKALQDYQEVQKLTKLDKTCMFNKLLCEGILAAEIENYDAAMSNFDKAIKIYKNKMEPYFYKACLTVQSFRKSHQKLDKSRLTSALGAALKYLETALQINENCSNLYYIKSLVLYAMDELDLSYANIEKAIDKADDNYAKYYFLKGAIYGAAGNYYNAISDLSIAISLDKNYRLAYLERGKCYFTLGHRKEGFLDIQTYTSIKGNDPNIHLWAGNLLFCTGAYEAAARAYSNSENITKSEQLLCLRAKCYIVIKELNLALSDLNKLIDLQTPNNIHYFIDKECLYSLKLASLAAEGDTEENLDNINIVKGIQTISKILSYKMSGKIFQFDDFYFYKAVFHFYLKEYDQALDDLDTAWEFRQELNSVIKNRAKMNRDESEDHIKISEEHSQHEKSVDETEKSSSFTRHEYYYNRAIFLIMANKYKESITTLEQLRDQSPAPALKQKVDSLIKLLQLQILRELKEKEPFNASKPKPQEFAIFSYTNRLCSIFPSFKLPVLSNTLYEVRLSFCLPTVEPPSMAPTINADVLDDVTVLSVENRPEAPWIKRNPEGVVFTTEDSLQKEEKEIPDLKEIIERNGLKEEEIYRSLGNSGNIKANEPVSAEPEEVTESSGGRHHEERAIPTHELLAYNLPDSIKEVMKRFL